MDNEEQNESENLEEKEGSKSSDYSAKNIAEKNDVELIEDWLISDPNPYFIKLKKYTNDRLSLDYFRSDANI